MDRRRYVLVVEEDVDVRESTAMLLEFFGYEVDVAECGERALEMLASRHPDVMLVDVSMPGISGPEVARRVRRMPGGYAIRLFAYSGYGDMKEACRAAVVLHGDGHVAHHLAQLCGYAV